MITNKKITVAGQELCVTGPDWEAVGCERPLPSFGRLVGGEDIVASSLPEGGRGALGES